MKNAPLTESGAAPCLARSQMPRLSILNKDLVCRLYFGQNCRKRGNTQKHKKRLKIGCNSMFGAALTDRLEMWDFYSLSPGFLSTLCCRTNICTFVQLGGGVRLRSSLSAEEAQNPKWHFRAETVTFFIDSYILRAYYMKSYKKLNQMDKILKSHNLQWGLGPK